MQKWIKPILSQIFLILPMGCSGLEESMVSVPSSKIIEKKAQRLAKQLLIVDTHIDVPHRLVKEAEDISIRTEGGDFDYPRARKGGLDAAFMSIFVPVRYQESGGAAEYADKLIDMVIGFERNWPNKFRVIRSVAEVQSLFGSGQVALAMGMENGAPLEGCLQNLKYFYDQGVRYITLAHSLSNQISDSSYDSNRRWNGLSPFGREVVKEMNRLGIMIDISHVSDEAFLQVIELTKAPVLASHSSCRHFTPGWERNMSDNMIRKLAAIGGVIQIAFGSSFIRNKYRLKNLQRTKEIKRYLHSKGMKENDPDSSELIRQFKKTSSLELANVSEVLDHIDHVRDLVGIEHVGFGSDFDGVGDTMPEGLRDVSHYPNLIEGLLKRGYSEKEIQKISSGNILRLWKEVERIAEKE